MGKEYHGTTDVMHIVRLLPDEVGYDKIRESVVRPLEDLKKSAE